MRSSTRRSTICVDANLVVRLVAVPRDDNVVRLWRQWRDERREFAAPLLIRYEVTNALYRSWRYGLIRESAARTALQAAMALPIQLHDEADLHERAMLMAGRFALPAAYDAHYLALAEMLTATFWTSDRKLVQLVKPALPWVHLAQP